MKNSKTLYDKPCSCHPLTCLKGWQTELKSWQRVAVSTLLFSITLAINAQEVIELNQCWQKLIENHVLSTNRQILSEIERLKLKNTHNQWYPQLGISGQAMYQSDAINLSLMIPDPSTQPISFVRRSIESPHDQYKIYLDAQQPIYLGGTRKYASQNIIIASQIDALKNDIELRKLIEQVNTIYFQILLTRKKQELGSIIVQTLKEKEKSISAAVRNGILQESDLAQLQVEILRTNQNVTELTYLLQGLYDNLKELTGIPISDSTLFLPPAIETFDSLAGKKFEVATFEAQHALLENTRMMSISRRRPSIIAFAQAGYGRPALNMLSTNFETYYIIGITLRWTIFDWNSSRNEQQQLLMQQQYIDNQQSTFEQQIRLASRLSLARIQQYVSSLRTDSAIVELRQNITRRSSSRLDKGLITTTDYLNDLNAEHQAKIQLETDAIMWLQEKLNYNMLKGTIESLVLQKNK